MSKPDIVKRLTARKSRSDLIFDIVNIVLLIAISIIFVVPVLQLLSISVTSTAALYKYGRFLIIPAEITWDSYRWILSSDILPVAFFNSVKVTVLGTTIQMVLTTLAAYPLSRKGLPGRKLMITFVVFPMLFSGGLIPLFILIKNLGIMDTHWAVILPWAIFVWYLLIMKSYMENIPEELTDAAKIDGANEWQILTMVVLPLSKPVLASLSLFYAVANWNNFFLPLMFLNTSTQKTLPIVVRDILIDAMSTDKIVRAAGYSAPNEAMKMAAIVVILLPLLLVYPFLQRYFTKGMLLGSIKG